MNKFKLETQESLFLIKTEMEKRKIYVLGLITLIVFPIPSLFILYYLEGITPFDILKLGVNWSRNIAYGCGVGITYAAFALIVLQAPIFKKVPLKVTDLVRKLNLNFWDALFLSFCAGIGEELLFRVGVQHYLGIYLTAILFVAVHGYFSIKEPLISLYGLVVLPLSIILGLGFEYLGFWFSAAIHFSYDLVLFLAIMRIKK
jgi:hypothetical protein